MKITTRLCDRQFLQLWLARQLFGRAGLGREYENDYKLHYKRDNVPGSIEAKHQLYLLVNVCNGWF